MDQKNQSRLTANDASELGNGKKSFRPVGMGGALSVSPMSEALRITAETSMKFRRRVEDNRAVAMICSEVVVNDGLPQIIELVTFVYRSVDGGLFSVLEDMSGAVTSWLARRPEVLSTVDTSEKQRKIINMAKSALIDETGSFSFNFAALATAFPSISTSVQLSVRPKDVTWLGSGEEDSNAVLQAIINMHATEYTGEISLLTRELLAHPETVQIISTVSKHVTNSKQHGAGNETDSTRALKQLLNI